MKKNNFLKYGKVFVSSVLVSICSSIGVVSYGGGFQESNQTRMTLSVQNDHEFLENKIKSIGNNKNNIKNNLKIYSRNAVTMNSMNGEKKLGEETTHVKKNKSLVQKILKKIKYLISPLFLGIGYKCKNKFFSKKGQIKYNEIDLQQPGNQDHMKKYSKQGFGSHSSFHHAPDDDDGDDDSKTPKFFPATTTGPKNPSTQLKNYEKETTTDTENLDDIITTDEEAAPVGNEDLNAPNGPNN